jgi:hypothetical protein
LVLPFITWTLPVLGKPGHCVDAADVELELLDDETPLDDGTVVELPISVEDEGGAEETDETVDWVELEMVEKGLSEDKIIEDSTVVELASEVVLDEIVTLLDTSLVELTTLEVEEDE